MMFDDFPIGLHDLRANQVAARALSRNATSTFLDHDRSAPLDDGGGGLSADPRYAENISPINRARRVARQTRSRGLGFAHNERRPTEHVIAENVGEHARAWYTR